MEISEHYIELLKKIDANILNIEPKNIPRLFNDIPLELFGELSLQQQGEFSHIRQFFPQMANKEIQIGWTGTHGHTLLQQSIAFIRTVVNYYISNSMSHDLSDLNLLDFGCGWGRLIRLFYKYIPETQIYGVDAWEQSLQTSRDYNVRANFAKIDDICTSIPFKEKFDLVISFSVFTHLSKKACDAALNSIRKSVKDDGILVLTIRPFEFWNVFTNDDAFSKDKIIQNHIHNGFSFVPHNRELVNGEVTFGDTSISLEYVISNWTSWKLIDSQTNVEDSYQKILFLKPC